MSKSKLFPLVLGVATVLMAALPSPTLAQTYTVSSSSPTPLQIDVQAGQTVTVTATLQSSDPDENGEGEPLVVQLPGGDFVVSDYFAPKSTTLIAIQDHEVVNAFIQGADGDESATVTFDASKPRFTKTEKDHFFDLSTQYKHASEALSVAAAAAAEEPPLAFVLALEEAAAAAIADHYDQLEHDPADPNFMTIAQPTFPNAPGIQAQPPFVTPAVENAYSALLSNQEHQLGFIRAIVTCINRSSGAAQAGNSLWESRQLDAAATYGLQLSILLSSQSSLRADLLAALRAAGVPSVQVTPDQVLSFEQTVAANGLPANELQLLSQLGLTSDDISQITGAEIVQDPNIIAALLPIPDELGDTTLAASESASAEDLMSFGIRLAASVPLKQGELVQAQGLLGSPGLPTAKVKIDVKFSSANVLNGKVELTDLRSGLSLQATLQSALIVGGKIVLAQGAYQASDGTNGSLTVVGDSDQKNLMILLANGKAWSGQLGGSIRLQL